MTGIFPSMFDFSAHELTYGEHGWYDSKPIEFKKWRDTLFASQLKLQKAGFAANIIENHDEPRGASRYLPEHARNEAGKKMLGTTSILLRGIPFIYQGQEIGMTNCIRNDISEYDDISTKDQYQVAIDAGCSREEALRCCYENSRDNARTPMQWTDDENAGFTDGTPWLAMNPNYRQINVREQEARTDSVLAYYRDWCICARRTPTGKHSPTVSSSRLTRKWRMYLRITVCPGRADSVYWSQQTLERMRFPAACLSVQAGIAVESESRECGGDGM